MSMSKNQRRKIERYADPERYYAYLYNILTKGARGEAFLIFRDEDGEETKRERLKDIETADKTASEKADEGHIVELKKVLSTFKNQLDYSLMRKDRDMLNGFVEYVRKRNPELAELAKHEIIHCITQINHGY